MLPVVIVLLFQEVTTIRLVQQEPVLVVEDIIMPVLWVPASVAEIEPRWTIDMTGPQVICMRLIKPVITAMLRI